MHTIVYEAAAWHVVIVLSNEQYWLIAKCQSEHMAAAITSWLNGGSMPTYTSQEVKFLKN